MVLRKVAATSSADAIAPRLDPRVRLETVGELFQAWQARRILRRVRPDVAHAHLSRACRALQGLDRADGVGLRLATLHIQYKPQQHAGLDATRSLRGSWPTFRKRNAGTASTTGPGPKPPAPMRDRLRREAGIAPEAFVFGALDASSRAGSGRAGAGVAPGWFAGRCASRSSGRAVPLMPCVGPCRRMC